MARIKMTHLQLQISKYEKTEILLQKLLNNE